MSKNIKLITFENFPFGSASANFLRNLSLSITQENRLEVILPIGNTSKIPINDSFNAVPYTFLTFKKHPKNIIGKLFVALCSFFSSFIYLIKQNRKEHIDCIILYNVFYQTHFPIFLAKRIIKSKLILLLPEFYERPRGGFIDILKWHLFNIGINRLSPKADGFIVLSHFLKQFIVDKGIDKPIEIIPNAIDPQRFELAEPSIFKDGFTTIGYVGTPTRKDGIDDLINAFALLHSKKPATHLLIIGDLDTSHTIIPSLKEKAKELDILDDVTFTGLVQGSEVPKLLQSCQILTLARPSGVFAEAGFPTKLGEYFACKKPVVVTKVGDIPLYFKHREHVMLADPDNPQSVAACLEELIDNEMLSQTLVNNAYLWMKDRLYYKSIAKKVNDLIARV